MGRIAKPFFPWVGGKLFLLPYIFQLLPRRAPRLLEVCGGSGAVTLGLGAGYAPLRVYNDVDVDLVNLFRCARDRPLALLRELDFLPLHARADFEVVFRFLNHEYDPMDYLEEELQITEDYLPPMDRQEVKKLLVGRANLPDVQRAAAYYLSIRYSYSATGNSFGGRSVELRRFLGLLRRASDALQGVVVENKDCVDLIRQYDREDAFFYCDPPYYDAEDCYAVGFPKEDHQRLHDALLECQGFVMVSYNYCPFIVELYKEFYIFYTTRPNSMSQKAGSEYEEIVITNYDPRLYNSARHWQLSIFNLSAAEEDDGRYTLIHEPKTKSDKTEE